MFEIYTKEKTIYMQTPFKKKLKTENIGTFKMRNFNFNIPELKISGRHEFLLFFPIYEILNLSRDIENKVCPSVTVVKCVTLP
jgi:hypothetical protein